MFNNLGWPEIVVLLLLGMFIFGPDKLPKAISDGVQMLRQVRRMAANATSDLSRELGTDIQLEDLHPKTFIRKHLLSEEDEQALRRPIEQLYRGVKDDVASVRTELSEARDSVDLRTAGAGRATTSSQPATSVAGGPDAGAAAGSGPPAQRYDVDAT